MVKRGLEEGKSRGIGVVIAEEPKRILGSNIWR